MQKTIYTHHPVMITEGLLATGEDWAGQTMLEVISALLDSGSIGPAGGGSEWGVLQLVALCTAQSIDVPAGAGAVILEVDVREADGANFPYPIIFGYDGCVSLAQKANASGVGTDTIFETDLTQEDDYYNGMTILFTSGGNIGEFRNITGYAQLNGQITVSVAFTGAPGAGDDFIIEGTNFPGRSFPVYCAPAADRWATTRVIIPLITAPAIIDYLVIASGDNTFDYRIRLIGWVILGEAYEKPTGAREDLACGFSAR